MATCYTKVVGSDSELWPASQAPVQTLHRKKQRPSKRGICVPGGHEETPPKSSSTGHTPERSPSTRHTPECNGAIDKKRQSSARQFRLQQSKASRHLAGHQDMPPHSCKRLTAALNSSADTSTFKALTRLRSSESPVPPGTSFAERDPESHACIAAPRAGPRGRVAAATGCQRRTSC